MNKINHWRFIPFLRRIVNCQLSIVNCLLILCPFSISAQVQFHSPAEVLEIMKNSKEGYQAGPLMNEIACQQGVSLSNGYYIDTTGGAKALKKYTESESEDIQKWREKAIAALEAEKPDYESARKFFLKILKKSPRHAEVMTLIGTTYLDQENQVKAVEWFEKAIELNYYDYYAHWQLAQALLDKGETVAAQNEITIAHLLNRNSQRLNIQLRDIYFINKKPLDDWTFCPQYNLHELQDAIGIDAKGVWLTYSFYKALWRYEPNYKTKMLNGNAGVEAELLEEMECLLGLYITYSGTESNAVADIPAIDGLGKAIEHKMLEEYIFYEIILPQKPETALYMEKSFLERMKNYLLTVKSSE